MTCPFPSVTLTDQSPLIVNSKLQTSKMMIPDPWSDPKIKKNGLYDMYIIDSIMYNLNISAELNPEIKLINPNPVYIKITKYIKDLLHSKDSGERVLLFDKIINIIKREKPEIKLNIVYWDQLVPDIRVLDEANQCLSWLYSVIVMAN